MIVQSGKKEGKSTQELVLKEPDWVQAFLSKVKEGKVFSAFKAHIEAFNSRPFEQKCFGCKGPATRASLHIGNAKDPYYWCDDCNPYNLGAVDGKLVIVTSYRRALEFVDWYCGGSRTDKRFLIRKLAVAKGLPGRVGQKEAATFLA